MIEKVQSFPEKKADGSIVMFANIESIYRKVFEDILSKRYIGALNAIIEDETNPMTKDEIVAVALSKGVCLEWKTK